MYLHLSCINAVTVDKYHTNQQQCSGLLVRVNVGGNVDLYGAYRLRKNL